MASKKVWKTHVLVSERPLKYAVAHVRTTSKKKAKELFDAYKRGESGTGVMVIR